MKATTFIHILILASEKYTDMDTYVNKNAVHIFLSIPF